MSENNEPIFSVLSGKAACQVGGGYCECPSGQYAAFYYEYQHYEVDGVLYGDNVTMCCFDGWSASISPPNAFGGYSGTCQDPNDPNYTRSTNDVYCTLDIGECTYDYYL